MNELRKRLLSKDWSKDIALGKVLDIVIALIYSRELERLEPCDFSRN